MGTNLYFELFFEAKEFLKIAMKSTSLIGPKGFGTWGWAFKLKKENMIKKRPGDDPVLRGNEAPYLDGERQHPFFHVVMVEPEIPQNTGNVGRTCVATGSQLHIVGPTGFQITDKNLKRAGLDYWQHLNWNFYEDLSNFQSVNPDHSRCFYFSAFAEKSLWEVSFKEGDWFFFGKETKGLPEPLWRGAGERALKLPHFGPVRGLNVATAVAVALYEAHRQIQDFGVLPQ